MNNKALTLSLVMAIFAVFMVQSYVGGIEDEAKKRFGTEVLVITAKRDIREMEMLNETMLDFKVVPKTFLEPAAISFGTNDEKETTRVRKDMAGKIAMVPIKKGEQVTLTKVSDPSIRSGLAPQITPGKRAVAIPVGEISGVSKLVKPGDRVDVIAVVDPGGGKDQKIARTVLQDTVVLAVGRNVSNNAPRVVEANSDGREKVRSLVEDFSFASVTLEVDPIQAQTIALLLANGEGSLTVSLRNNDDGDRFNLGATTFQDLMGPDYVRRIPAARK